MNKEHKLAFHKMHITNICKYGTSLVTRKRKKRNALCPQIRKGIGKIILLSKYGINWENILLMRE